MLELELEPMYKTINVVPWPKGKERKGKASLLCEPIGLELGYDWLRGKLFPINQSSSMMWCTKVYSSSSALQCNAVEPTNLGLAGRGVRVSERKTSNNG